jgi:uncharacterized MAPEG superfamily protein
VLYVTNRATARTLVWSAGMAVSIALMVSPVWA